MSPQAVAFAQYAQSAAATASPSEIVRMAYQRVLTACDRSAAAVKHRPADWLQVFHDETIRGQQILLELSAGLALHHADPEVVEMAESMDSLYEYAMHQLMQANVEKSAEPLYAVQLVIGGLLDAWVHSI
jgi:flagellar secretion chaperone FliS